MLFNVGYRDWQYVLLGIMLNPEEKFLPFYSDHGFELADFLVVHTDVYQDMDNAQDAVFIYVDKKLYSYYSEDDSFAYKYDFMII